MLGVRRLQKMSMQRWLVLFDRLPKVALALCAGAASRLLSAVRLLSYSEEKEDSKRRANFDRPVPWEALLRKNTWISPLGDASWRCCTQACDEGIAWRCCRIDCTEEEQESGNEVQSHETQERRDRTQRSFGSALIVNKSVDA